MPIQSVPTATQFSISCSFLCILQQSVRYWLASCLIFKSYPNRKTTRLTTDNYLQCGSF